MIRLKSLHHVRFSAIDLEAAENFARDFGLVRAAGNDRSLYMRGAGAGAYQYVVHKGDADRLLGIAFAVESREDLEEAVRLHGGTPIRQLEGPAGGVATTLVDPEGVHFDLVADSAERVPDPPRKNLTLNFGNDKPRKGVAQALPPDGPAQLLRLGHVGLYVKDFARCATWCQDVLGLLPSDLMYMHDPDHPVAGFLRLDRGGEYVDHHTIFLVGAGHTDLHHLSFEVQDFEAQFQAHKWLRRQGHLPVWGVGRHPLGCHIFDLWMSPSGYRFETFSDTDVCTAERPCATHDITKQAMDVWSSDPPDRYFRPRAELLGARQP